MKNRKTLEMAQMAVLVAIILIMAFTPLGYLRTGGLEISLLTIPVVIGAMVMGPGAGLTLGTVFGLTSFYQCFGMSAFGAALLGINPLLTFFVCVPTRSLMGWCSGIIFRELSKIDKTHTVSYFVTGLLGALLNTTFFMSAFLIGFWNTEFVQGINQAMGDHNIILFLILFVGINGLLELPLTCMGGGAVAKALNKAFKNATISNVHQE